MSLRKSTNMCKSVNSKTLGDYSHRYLKSDDLLLTDIFEIFPPVCLQTYKTDPAQ